MSSGFYLKRLAKMLEISSFFVFQGNSGFWMIEQAELNRAFFCKIWRAEPSWAFWKAWQAEPSRAFFPKTWAKTELSRAELRLRPNTTTYGQMNLVNGFFISQSCQIVGTVSNFKNGWSWKCLTFRAFTQNILQSIKNSFEQVNLSINVYWLVFATPWNSTTVCVLLSIILWRNKSIKVIFQELAWHKLNTKLCHRLSNSKILNFLVFQIRFVKFTVHKNCTKPQLSHFRVLIVKNMAIGIYGCNLLKMLMINMCVHPEQSL